MPPDATNVAEYAVPTWPLGRDVVVIASGATLLVVVSVSPVVAVSAGLLASVTLKVSGVPDTATVGVPVIAPVDAFSESPAGKLPLVSDQAYGVVPPVAVRVAEYGVPTCPFGSEGVVILRGADVMLKERVVALVCAGVPESVTLNCG